MLNIKKLKELIENTEFNFLDIEYAKECNNEESLYEWIIDRINEQYIFYCSRAIKYLSEHDPSLYNSLEIAQECGYELKDLNSEVLATILYQSELRKELSELDLSECFNN